MGGGGAECGAGRRGGCTCGWGARFVSCVECEARLSSRLADDSFPDGDWLMALPEGGVVSHALLVVFRAS